MDEKRIEPAGYMREGSTLVDIAKMIIENVSEESDGRAIQASGFVVGWDDGTFSHYSTSGTGPEDMKRMADILASAAEYWFNAWRLTQDDDDYGTDDLYVS